MPTQWPGGEAVFSEFANGSETRENGFLLQASNSRDLQQRLFSMLQGCKSMRELARLHARLVVNGFSQKNFLITKLLSFCVSSNNLYHATQAFDMVMEPSTTLYNQMIRAFSRSATPETSLRFYKRMRASAMAQPNSFTFAFLLGACAALGTSLLKQGEQLHARILSGGFGADVYVQTNLVNMYAAAADAAATAEARKVFDDMPHRNVVSWNAMLAGYLRSGDTSAAFQLFDQMRERNAVSWTTMIAGCVQSGRSMQALTLFREMRRARIGADQVTFVAALSACAELGDLEMGRWIHSRIDRGASVGERRLVSLNNALIHAYVKCGAVRDAYRVFQEMPRRSTVSWTTMIAGLTIHGHGNEALDLFQAMQSTKEAVGEKPDAVTFIAVLNACSRTGKIDEGYRYFEQMSRVYGISPGIEHHGCMVDMLSRAGRLSEAWQQVETMPVQPNEAVWGALLNGCRAHRDTNLASVVVDRLMKLELEPEHAAGYLVILSNVYAAAGKWDDVRRVRERMVKMGLSKPPGRSWVHVNGLLHSFAAGDRSHRCASDIYRMVGEIAARAKLAGIAPDTSRVLLDVEEEEEREAFLQHHSEKLAIAFGLISVPDVGEPIRVMSNICICSDCHSTAKFVSKDFNREIIVRDQNLFHHFVDGCCSCKDCW